MASEVTSLTFELLGKDKLSKEFLKAGAAVGGVGLVVAEFAKKSVEAYTEAENAQTRLAYAYKQFPAVANVSLQSLKDLADETQKKTIFDHNATMEAEAQLAQFKLNGSQIEALIPLVQDLAAKQGIGLTEASTAVGKAMLGSAKALKGVGIAFKATGDTAKDFTTLQGLLNDKVGGFAEAQGKTAAGQAIELQNAYKDLQETIGAALVPVLQDVVNVAKPMLEVFNGLPKPVQQTGVILGGLGVAAYVAVPKVLALRASLIEMGIAGGGAAAGLEATAVAEGEVAVASGGAAGAMKVVAALAGPATLLIGAAGLSWKLYSDNAQDAEHRSHVLADGLKADGGIVGEHTKKAIDDALAIGGLSDAYKAAGVNIEKVNKAIGGSSQDAAVGLKAVADADVGAGASSVGAGKGATAQYMANQKLTAGLQVTRDELIKQQQAYRDTNWFNAQYNGTLQRTIPTAKAAGNAVLEAALKELDAAKRVRDARHAGQVADKSATDQIKKLNAEHKANAEQLDKVKRAALDAAQKNGDYRGELVKLEKQTKPGSPMRVYLDQLIAKLDLAAQDRTSTLTLNVINQQQNQGERQHGGSYPPAPHPTPPPPPKSGGHGASGGYHSGITTVGEYGREVVDLGSQSRVYTASQTAAMKANGASDRPIQVNLNVDGRVLATALLKQQRDGVKITLN